METRMIREATSGDSEAIASVKAAYIRQLYQGFVQESILQLLASPDCSSIPGQTFSTLCDCEDSAVCGYIVFGRDPENPESGIIDDIAFLPGSSRDVRDELISAAIEELNRQGVTSVHMWIMRENFRARFLFEQYGFRWNGTVRSGRLEDRTVEFSEYTLARR